MKGWETERFEMSKFEMHICDTELEIQEFKIGEFENDACHIEFEMHVCQIDFDMDACQIEFEIDVLQGGLTWRQHYLEKPFWLRQLVLKVLQDCFEFALRIC